jgi:hypothetical protein
MHRSGGDRGGCPGSRAEQTGPRHVVGHQLLAQLPAQHLVIGRAGNQQLEVRVSDGEGAQLDQPQVKPERAISPALQLNGRSAPSGILAVSRHQPADGIGPDTVERKDRREWRTPVAVETKQGVPDLAGIAVPGEHQVDRILERFQIVGQIGQDPPGPTGDGEGGKRGGGCGVSRQARLQERPPLGAIGTGSEEQHSDRADSDLRTVLHKVSSWEMNDG